MIKLNKQVDYALQLLGALHTHGTGTPLSLKDFSNESTISFLFLQKIAKLLRESGLISARKGSGGGYELLRPIHTISLKEVVEAIDGPYGVSTCTTPGKTCVQTHECHVKKGMEKMHSAVIRELQQMTVAEMIS